MRRTSSHAASNGASSNGAKGPVLNAGRSTFTQSPKTANEYLLTACLAFSTLEMWRVKRFRAGSLARTRENGGFDVRPPAP